MFQKRYAIYNAFTSVAVVMHGMQPNIDEAGRSTRNQLF